jgi:hypothetical protein
MRVEDPKPGKVPVIVKKSKLLNPLKLRSHEANKFKPAVYRSNYKFCALDKTGATDKGAIFKNYFRSIRHAEPENGAFLSGHTAQRL